MTIFVKNKHTLQIDEFKFICCIGKKGLTTNKKEGDKKTPRGTFEIENLYFRKSRIKKPSTLLKCIEIKKDMGWCDDVNFPKKYNKLIKIDKRYFRPNELNYLRGDYNKAKKLLKWKPKISFKNLVKEMVQEDIKTLKNGS